MIARGSRLRELERKDESDEIDSERENPEKRDGGDVGGEITGNGAQLHGSAHGQQDPEEFVNERGGEDL